MREQARAVAGLRAGNQRREAGGRALRKNNKSPATGKVEKDEERQLWGGRALLPARCPPAASPQAGQGDRYLGPAEAAATAGAKGRGGPTSAAPGETGDVPRPYCRRALPRPVAMAGFATARRRLRAGPGAGSCRLPPNTAQPGRGQGDRREFLFAPKKRVVKPARGGTACPEAGVGRTSGADPGWAGCRGGASAAPCRDSRPVSFTPPSPPRRELRARAPSPGIRSTVFSGCCGLRSWKC